jgi:hypothetical protein
MGKMGCYTSCVRLSREVLMIVDIHAHYFPKAYNDILMRIGGRRPRSRL